MSSYADRLAALREQLKADRLDGFVVPLTDEHMSEYVGSYAQRLAWLTGFQGSAGSAVVLPQEAAIFVDGRYTLQVRDQVDGNHWSYQSVPETSIADWLKVHAPDGGRIGYDPWLHTKDWVIKARDALAEKGAELVAVRRNPIDAVWADQPEPSRARLIVHADDYAGRSSAAKRQEMADWLKEQKADAAVLAASIRSPGRSTCAARTSTIRRSLCPSLWSATTARPISSSPPRRSATTSASISATASASMSASDFEPALAGLAGKTIAVDPERSVAAIFDALEKAGAHIVSRRDPSILPKAIKNAVEIAGHQAAQARDGAALSRFLHWLSIEAPKGGWTSSSRGQAPGFPPGRRRPSRSQLRHHLRRRPQWRHRPLQGQRADQPADRDGFDLPGRFGRPISGRHHRRDPHRGDRHADRGDEGPLHPRASGPYRARPRALPGRHARLAARQLRAPISVARRRSITPTAPAMASAASSRCTKGRSASRRSAAPSRAATSRSRRA